VLTMKSGHKAMILPSMFCTLLILPQSAFNQRLAAMCMISRRRKLRFAYRDKKDYTLRTRVDRESEQKENLCTYRIRRNSPTAGTLTEVSIPFASNAL
jgi:hypothetical protein